MRIGFVTTWKTRGTKYQTKLLADAINQKMAGNVDLSFYIYKHLELGPKDNFPYVFHRQLSDWTLKRWLGKIKPNAVFFIDRLASFGAIKYCKRKNIKILSTVMFESIFEDFLKRYNQHDTLIAPVRCTYDLLVKLGFSNVFYVPWTTDIPVEKLAQKISKTIRFFFNAGWGGGQKERKNPEAVVKAFSVACQENCNLELIFKTQKPLSDYSASVRDLCNQNSQIKVIEKNLSWPDLLNLYRLCDVALLPSKWEGIGLPFAESLALGLPVITVDAPPMNEWVQNGVNGYTCPVAAWENMDSKRHGKSMIEAAIIDIDEFAKKILKIADRAILKTLVPNTSRFIAERNRQFDQSIKALTERIL